MKAFKAFLFARDWDGKGQIDYTYYFQSHVFIINFWAHFITGQVSREAIFLKLVYKSTRP